MLHELFPECKLVYLVSLYKPHVAHLHPPSHSKPETTIPQKIKMTSRHPNLFYPNKPNWHSCLFVYPPRPFRSATTVLWYICQ